MAIRFQKRIKIAPGVRLNLSKSTISLTAGTKGASVNVGKSGKTLNLGIPGTGLSTRTKIGGGSKTPPAPAASHVEPAGRPLRGVLTLAAIGLFVWWIVS